MTNKLGPAAVKILAAAVGLAGILLFSVNPAWSQSANIDFIRIIGIDTDNFPFVSIQARVLGADTLPVENFAEGDITLTEDGVLYDYTFETIDAGSQVAIVADIGAGSGVSGATGKARFEEVRELLFRYVDGMGQNDSAMLILQNGETQVVQTLTSDKSTLRNAIASLEENPNVYSNGPAGVLAAISELESIASDRDRAQAVFFVSTGIQETPRTIYDDVRAAATEQEIVIFSMLTNTNPDIGEGVERMADDTSGIYAHYLPDNEAVSDIFTALSRLKTQFVLTYRSTSGAESMRSVSLEALGGPPPSPRDSVTYSIALQAPIVTIMQPEAATAYTRQAESFDQPIDTVTPTSATVAVDVTWPDGYERTVKAAQFFVNEEAYGSALLDPGNSFSFAWDLRPYRDEGETVISLRVEVQDDLSLLARSEPRLVTINVVIPEPPPIEGCVPELGTLKYLNCQITSGAGLVALIMSIPTLILIIIVWRNRNQIIEVTGSAGEAVTELVARVTRAADEGRTAAAYLTVLRGDPYLMGKKFAIYANTVTPIGRDKSQVEIVFPDEENSVISRKHCEIRQEDGQYKLRDFASTYGTFLNGQRLPELGVEVLHHGDEIGLGEIERGGLLLRFELVMTDENLSDELRDTIPA